ncbi:hypothetical protein BRD00_10285 [Halobacteriales archaeon QS_8_69_26]|nr:MAG: hypothetical protein BRD00_10285 [Halobacteriales archaeon QS_8_69_26]
MGRSVNLSPSGRTRQYLVAGFASLWAVVLSVQLLSVLVGGRPNVWGAVAALGVWVTMTVLWVRWTDDPGEGSAWEAIPGWQYGGRFVEAGGLTRSEQEEALGNSEDE